MTLHVRATDHENRQSWRYVPLSNKHIYDHNRAKYIPSKDTVVCQNHFGIGPILLASVQFCHITPCIVYRIGTIFQKTFRWQWASNFDHKISPQYIPISNRILQGRAQGNDEIYQNPTVLRRNKVIMWLFLFMWLLAVIGNLPCKYTIIYPKWAGIGPMLAASVRFRSSSGTWHVCGDFIACTLEEWAKHFRDVSKEIFSKHDRSYKQWLVFKSASGCFTEISITSSKLHAWLLVKLQTSPGKTLEDDALTENTPSDPSFNLIKCIRKLDHPIDID